MAIVKSEAKSEHLNLRQVDTSFNGDIVRNLMFEAEICWTFSPRWLACTRTSQWWRIPPPYPLRRGLNCSFMSQSCGRKLAGQHWDLLNVCLHVFHVWYFNIFQDAGRFRIFQVWFEQPELWDLLWAEFDFSAGTLPIWSKKSTTTPWPANGDAFGVRMTTNAHFLNSNKFWRSLLGCQLPFTASLSILKDTHDYGIL